MFARRQRGDESVIYFKRYPGPVQIWLQLLTAAAVSCHPHHPCQPPPLEYILYTLLIHSTFYFQTASASKGFELQVEFQTWSGTLVWWDLNWDDL